MRETRVVCLKGRIKELGPKLELAPAGFVYVGRRLNLSRFNSWDLPQSDWANPVSIKEAGSPEAAVERYGAWMAEPEQAELRSRIVPELAGCTLLCWCDVGKSPCHGLALARIADTAPIRQTTDFGPWDCEPAMPIPGRREADTVRPVGLWAGAL
jgi:hypothetical protein